jgi:hypothetical protein
MSLTALMIAGKEKEGNTPKHISVPFQGSRIVPFLRNLGTELREARAFPLQTLVLAFSARSRHIQPGMPEAGSGRNL